MSMRDKVEELERRKAEARKMGGEERDLGRTESGFEDVERCQLGRADEAFDGETTGDGWLHGFFSLGVCR